MPISSVRGVTLAKNDLTRPLRHEEMLRPNISGGDFAEPRHASRGMDRQAWPIYKFGSAAAAVYGRITRAGLTAALPLISTKSPAHQIVAVSIMCCYQRKVTWKF